jgi:hypothetical protein
MVTTKLTGDFLPGLGDPEPVALAAEVPSQGTILAAAATPLGIGLAVGFLFLTPMGKALRRKVGLG